MASRWLRVALIFLTSFLALTAFGGGIALLAGWNAPPVEMLAGTPFHDYTVPGLALFVIVGGCATAAAVLLVRRHRLAPGAALASGLVIIGFEVVEIWAIGSDPGVARTLQVVYLSVGAILAALSLAAYATRPDAAQGMG